MRTFAKAPAEGAPASDIYDRARAIGSAFGGWVVLVRPDGRQIFNTLRPLATPLPVAAGTIWIDRAIKTGKPVISNLFTGSLAQTPVLAVVVPVFPQGANGDPPAPLALVLAFDPERLAALLARVREGEIAGLVQIDDGLIIARSVNQAAAAGRRAPEWAATPLREHATGIANGPALEGAPIVAAFNRLDRVPWSVIVTAPEGVYQAAWRRPLLGLAVGSAALLAAGVGLAVLMARRLLRPLQALAREAEAVAAGEPATNDVAAGSVLEYESLRQALARATEATRARAISEGRAVAAEDAARELRAERDRARLYFNVSKAVLVVLDPQGAVQNINRGGLTVLGLAAEEEAIGRDWFATYLPERLRHPVRQAFAEIAAGANELYASYENPVLRADGEERLVAWRNSTLRDAAGGLIAVVASGEDITDRRSAEERQTLLMREVDHRAKNVMAVVQSIVQLTRADQPQDFAAAVVGRVHALARAHTLLARERWAGGNLHELVETELAAYGIRERVLIAGPLVRLAPDAVQPVSLVLHELASNAARHGSLSTPTGKVEVVWIVQADGRLRMNWIETMDPPLPDAGPPTRRGFGSRLIAANVAGALRGTVRFDWRASGLNCEIVIAADQLATREPNAARTSARPVDEPAGRELDARRILLVEDEPLVALDTEETLRSLGCEVVGPAFAVDEALRLAAAEAPTLDAAVLDVNLGGQTALPVARLLSQHGVPILFATGYSELPREWTSFADGGTVALLRKPIDSDSLAPALRRLVAPRVPR